MFPNFPLPAMQLPLPTLPNLPTILHTSEPGEKDEQVDLALKRARMNHYVPNHLPAFAQLSMPELGKDQMLNQLLHTVPNMNQGMMNMNQGMMNMNQSLPMTQGMINFEMPRSASQAYVHMNPNMASNHLMQGSMMGMPLANVNQMNQMGLAISQMNTMAMPQMMAIPNLGQQNMALQVGTGSKIYVKQKTSKSVYKRVTKTETSQVNNSAVHASGAEIRETSEGIKYYFCPSDCGTDGYEQFKSCKNHMKNCRVLNPTLPDHTCLICQRNYCRKDKLDAHTRLFHKPEAEGGALNAPKKYYKRITVKDTLPSSHTVHVSNAIIRETITGEKYFFCPSNCGTLGYELLRSCLNHMKDCRTLHPDLPEQRCEKCGYNFSRKSRLEQHLKMNKCDPKSHNEKDMDPSGM